MKRLLGSFTPTERQKGLALLVAFAGSILVHELVHTIQAATHGLGLRLPVVWPWTLGLEHCDPGWLACVETGASTGQWWEGEPLAYAVQAVFFAVAAVYVWRWKA